MSKPTPSACSSKLWGDAAALAALFGEAVTDLRCRRRSTTLQFTSGVAETAARWLADYGPAHGVFETLAAAGRENLRSELEWLFSSNDVSNNGARAIKAEYLEVLATLKA